MKGYNGNQFFDNEIGEETGSEKRFSMEAVVRTAVQRMIQGALEAEVTEFLGRKAGREKRAGRGVSRVSERVSRRAADHDSGWGVDGKAATGIGRA